MEKNTKFASKVKDIRERQNMSIEELSEKSGVKIEVPFTDSSYKNGQSPWSKTWNIP